MERSNSRPDGLGVVSGICALLGPWLLALVLLRRRPVFRADDLG
ncbi:MAG TPA: hypothetical protein QGF58_11305 [Myxococcota bacterium]|nr:hypothetical protein [Myxococcota bacterium]